MADVSGNEFSAPSTSLGLAFNNEISEPRFSYALKNVVMRILMGKGRLTSASKDTARTRSGPLTGSMTRSARRARRLASRAS